MEPQARLPAHTGPAAPLAASGAGHCPLQLLAVFGNQVFGEVGSVELLVTEPTVALQVAAAYRSWSSELGVIRGH